MARIALLAALVFAGLGCGADPCADTSCPNDTTKQTSSQYNDCVSRHNADKNKTCNQESVALEICAGQSTVCNSAGRTDGSATLSKYNSSCRAAQDAVTCCALAAVGFGTCK